MATVIWAPSALDDIDLIAEYIARDSKDRAALFVDRIFDIVEHLEQYPDSGRIIPEINNKSSREIIYGSYRIMYNITDTNEVWIVAVVHGAQNRTPGFEK